MTTTMDGARRRTRPFLTYVGACLLPVLATMLTAAFDHATRAGVDVLWLHVTIGLGTSVFALLTSWTVLVRQLHRATAAREREALYDALTGLPNRAPFVARAEHAVAEARRYGGGVAVVLVDLDRFKEVNETLGHATGDALLRAMGERLRTSLREVDAVARLGGDEFGLVLPGVADADTARFVLGRAITAISAELELEELPLSVEASFGVALFPADGSDVETLMQRADIALYWAKGSARNVVVYEPSRDHHNRERLALMGELRRALERDELVLHFQPKSTLPTGEVSTVEALVRWQHPARGLLFPDVFLPVAEQTGLIEPLTDWVLRAALRQVKQWQEFAPSLAVAVNVSARSLQSLGFVDRVAAALHETSAAPADLVLEMTETALVADAETASDVLRRLDARGIPISLDDFGRGYTSLAYLQRLPLSEIKIDKSFVLDLDNSQGDAAIVRSVIELGHNLGLAVTAEGVETAQTLTTLAELGCDTAQGYYLSRPLAAERLETWLRDHALRLSLGRAAS